MVKIFKAAIGKKKKSWYVENILDLTLGLLKTSRFYSALFFAPFRGFSKSPSKKV